MRRPVVLVLTWLLGTAVALGLSTLAVRAVGQRLDDPPRAVPVAAGPTITTTAPPTAPTSAPSGGAGLPTSEAPGVADAPPTSASAPLAPGTYRTQGGVVIVACAGDAATLVGTSPAVGWSVDVRDAGPERVEVRFELAAEGAEEDHGAEGAEEHEEAEAGTQARVRASCRGGVIDAEVS